MRSKPNSFIGLLAIDKSVRALKSGHDIGKEDLLDEIRSYDVGQETSFYPWVQTIKSTEGNLYWYTGAAGSKQVYANSGVFILTLPIPIVVNSFAVFYKNRLWRNEVRQNCLLVYFYSSSTRSSIRRGRGQCSLRQS